jgi:hypothetical protein
VVSLEDELWFSRVGQRVSSRPRRKGSSTAKWKRTTVTDDLAAVGQERTGELARKELAEAARDPRMDRPAGSPIPDFNDAFAEIGRARRAAIFALERTARTGTPSDGPTNERQALWEQSELARAERDGDYAWINAASLWSLHSALDALVEQNTPAVVDLVARIEAQELVNKATAKEPELAAQLPDALERSGHRDRLGGQAGPVLEAVGERHRAASVARRHSQPWPEALTLH